MKKLTPEEPSEPSCFCGPDGSGLARPAVINAKSSTTTRLLRLPR